MDQAVYCITFSTAIVIDHW